MNIDSLTYGEIKKIAELFGKTSTANESLVDIGSAYLFRTVTHIEVGRVVKICGDFVTLENASWIADTGRYHDCLVNGTFDEVESYPETTTVNLASLINFAPWPHSLPTEQQ